MQNLKEYQDLYKVFITLREKFDDKNVYLYLSGNEEINAYAVGGFRKSAIILTQGIMTHISENSENIEDFTKSMAGIIGHEMSHIKNMDFLPGVFMRSIESSIKVINKMSQISITIPAYLLTIIPLIGGVAKWAVLKTYDAINFISSKVIYGAILLSFHSFLAKALSRSTEYRSDMDSALAIGGDCIYLGLEKINFGNSSVWKSVFSTHPNTRSRMSKVINVQPINGKITPSVITDFANMWSLLMLILLTCVLAYKSSAIDIPRYAIKTASLTIDKVIQIKSFCQSMIKKGEEIYSLYEKLSSIFGK